VHPVGTYCAKIEMFGGKRQKNGKKTCVLREAEWGNLSHPFTNEQRHCTFVNPMYIGQVTSMFGCIDRTRKMDYTG